MGWLVRGKKGVRAEPISDRFTVLSDPTRRAILEKVVEEPRYPAEIAKEMGVDKQKLYYHFEKLEEAELVESVGKKEVSGGTATYYGATADALFYDLDRSGENVLFNAPSDRLKEFLHPMLDNGEINGAVVVGSPDQHGEYEVRARDGHLAGEITAKLGNIGYTENLDISLDTEISELENGSVLLGGILTNTFTREVNGSFPIEFSTDEFPFHSVKTPEDSYNEDSIGVVARTEREGKVLFLVAGIRNRGTRAAVAAFRDLEELVEGHSGDEFYRVVRGQDLDGDGKIDDYEVVE